MELIAEYDRLELVLDSAAALTLFGVMHYTSHYRRRGRTDDKIYFWILVVTILCAISDAAACVVDAQPDRVLRFLNVAFNDIFMITMNISFWLMALYFDYRSNRVTSAAASLREPVDKKRACVLLLPAVFTVIAIGINHFIHFIFWPDETTGIYTEQPQYYVLYIAPALYAAFIVIISRLNKSGLFVLLMLIATRSVLEGVMQGVSSTALFIAIVLVFMHINEMRYAFYDEERNTVGEGGGFDGI